MAEMAVYRLFLRTEVGNLTDYANFVNRYQLVTRAARGYRAGPTVGLELLVDYIWLCVHIDPNLRGLASCCYRSSCYSAAVNTYHAVLYTCVHVHCLYNVVHWQVLVHVTASDVDDSDQNLPITYNLVSADGFIIDHQRSVSSLKHDLPHYDLEIVVLRPDTSQQT